MMLRQAAENPTLKTDGQFIVEALEANGVERVFCVPGESYLAVPDALHDSRARTIVCRQEGSAALAPSAIATRPGVSDYTDSLLHHEGWPLH